MAAMLETPSRVWRRIEAIEGRDMPSLPSLPAFEDSEQLSESNEDTNDDFPEPLPIQSTPALSHRTVNSTIRPPSSASSTVRFAQSIASRSSKSALSASRGSAQKPALDASFDISSIPSLPDVQGRDDEFEVRSSDQDTEASSMSDVYLAPTMAVDAAGDLEGDLDISDALQSVSRPNSPELHDTDTPQKKYDYSVSLRTEKKASPFDKMRHVSFRRPVARTRTPSLTRTTPSPSSSSEHSTPRSNRSLSYMRPVSASPLAAMSVPLPRSATASPVLINRVEEPSISQLNLSHESVSGEDEAEAREMTQGTNITNETTEQDDPREPTFSSEDTHGPSEHGNNDALRAQTPMSAIFSSPAPSAMFTPTPVFQPRPRARFNAPLSVFTPQPPCVVEYDPDETPREIVDETATPNAHKRSFLLSVINSTARPKFKYPTPHPNRAGGVQAPMTPGVNLQSAFAGVTPRPAIHRRLSHPLAQEVAGDAASPYDSGVDRVSFVSTTSSHDLTTHARANASFDPVMGLGERGHGVGRFNAGKLNSYLHGLNRRLQEENETLVARLKTYEERYGKEGGGSPGLDVVQDSQSRRKSGGRRDMAEGWTEEKAALEEMAEELKEELAEEALLQERNERDRDKERFRERMVEVETGVERIIRELEKKAADAQQAVEAAEDGKAEAVRDVERRLIIVTGEKEALADQVKNAERALEGGKELGAELNATNQRVSQIKELEEEVIRADEKLDDLEKELREERELNAALEEDLQAKSDELAGAFQQIQAQENDLHKTRTELHNTRTYVEQLDVDAGNLEEQLAMAKGRNEALAADAEQDEKEIQRLSEDAHKASEVARQMEDALEDAETRMLSDEREVAALKSKVTALERAIEREQEQSKSRAGPSHSFAMEVQAEIEALEAELDDAHKEIARLNTLISQSPARKAIEKAKDAKIEALEQEREDLLERVKSLKNHSMTFNTPGKLSNIDGVSPMHRQIFAMSMKSPKTPGGPLRDLSWLQNTVHDPTVSPLVAEIARLQRELDRANESIDEKLDKLEDAGVGAVDLAQQVDDARARIVALEDELARLSRKEDRRIRRLQKAKCWKCHAKVDLRSLQRAMDNDENSISEASDMSIVTDPPTPPTKTSEALRANLRAVNTELVSMKKAWEDEKRRLLGENANLQDAAHQLDAQVRTAKDEIRKLAETERANERARISVQGELDRAKRIIDDLEVELRDERARLRTLMTAQSRAKREKEEVVLQMRRTESDIAGVKEHLQRVKEENHQLEMELHSAGNAEQKARSLETKVAGNAEIIEQLRQERSLLVADHKTLQGRYSKVSDRMNKLRDEYAASQTSHDNRRHQLDLQLLEIEDLRRALSDRADELHRAELEKNRIAAEKNDVAGSVAALEADLQRVRRDAEAFGRDLKLLRAQKDRLEEERKNEKAKTERAHKQSQTQIRLLKEELESQRENAKTVVEQWQGHVCAADGEQLVALKLQHNKECKGLIVQIRYLKAKFTRESAWRCDLGYQKKYLLVLLARLEKNEKTILGAIARIGYPTTDPPAPTRKRRSLKGVAVSIVFILRSRRASTSWREQSASKQAIATALQEVRRRRSANANADG
ncbi:hypothetical protein B0H21DRAFT_855438 [Amylocystis lapponica]|nr:hypothetical protein B0H21DRAFT_855438 [Amylocystis lapponica]